jgi:putative PIN family toxin of toxin-antitoxin system
MLVELLDVLVRPRLVARHGRSAEQVAAFVQALRQEAEVVSIPGTVHICRDPDDDVVIETAILGSAIYVVSGDRDTQARDLVEYLEARGIRVLTVREFLAELGAP